MTTFVLVHGAWHGGWCWSRVAAHLRARGNDVFSPTLTGLSDRAHLISPAVNLSTHVEDVVRLLDAEALSDVVLVGHSYAGMVISGVAEARSHLIRTRVHLDAFVPEDAESALDLLPTAVAGHYRESVVGPGFGWLIPPRSLEVLGVSDPEDVEWLTPRLTPQPWATYTQRISLAGNANSVPGAFVECTGWMRVFRAQAERARCEGWAMFELPTGHEAMVTAPSQLADLLLDVAATGDQASAWQTVSLTRSIPARSVLPEGNDHD